MLEVIESQVFEQHLAIVHLVSAHDIESGFNLSDLPVPQTKPTQFAEETAQ